MSRAGRGELTEWARARLPLLIDDAYGAILDRIELYRSGRLVPLDDLHRSVEQNLRSIVAATARPDFSLGLTPAHQTGRRRAN
ncbi:hypothetical protein ACWDWO_25890 [Actinopolymorpha singaporensis]|uniref:RsbT co-antagonist protein RsbRD N-terminal domain-containing protein n=1 Tax=Actinopolymorpha singaporensis TaxID=117157 RepID=A0A1H1MUI2_9ACTN|nr:hypothetical protein [Actinopolymorpha singaporensis]SDR90370.1 hypothetical protein SAMN04489717_0969 [Actinopolymorpha singaporensis]